jgi:hypothetical protein
MPGKVGKDDCRKVMLTVDGRTQCIADWVRDLPYLKHTTVADRKRKRWTDRQCLGIDPPPLKPAEIASFSYNGEHHTLREWEILTKINALTIKYRMKYGWTKGQALGYEPPPEQETGSDMEVDGEAEG